MTVALEKSVQNCTKWKAIAMRKRRQTNEDESSEEDERDVKPTKTTKFGKLKSERA